AYVADTIPPEHRARALGWLSAATSAGVMVGPAIGSSAAHWGRAAPGLVAAALCVTNVVFAWRRLPESKQKHPPDRAEPRASIGRAAWAVVRHPGRPASRLMWIYAVGMLAFTAFTSILSLYLGMDFGFTDKTVGYVFLYVGALARMLAPILSTTLFQRFGHRMPFYVAGIIVGLVSLLAFEVEPARDDEAI